MPPYDRNVGKLTYVVIMYKLQRGLKGVMRACITHDKTV